MSCRFGFDVWGANKSRRFFGDDYWNRPYTWNRKAVRDGTVYRVLCGSMCDIFEDHPDVKDSRHRLYDLIAETPNLEWLLLTKRIEDAEIFVPIPWLMVGNWPENVRLGVTVENQESIERVEALLSFGCPNFISVEPMLGPVILRGDWYDYLEGWTTIEDHDPNCRGDCGGCPVPVQAQTNTTVDWVIVGGESGPRRRPLDLEWARQLRDECASGAVPFFMKQVDKVQPIPDDLMIRQFPEPLEVTR
jgi:protein gp37